MMGQVVKRCGLPDFLIIGAAKSGTTSLYFYLRQHPDIYMPPDVKEPGFLCFAGWPIPETNPADPYPDVWRLVIPNRESYAALFTPAAENQLIGEATPEYLYLAERTIATIRSEYGEGDPGPRFVAVLRNPVDRLWSHYWMCRRDRYEGIPLEQALDPAVIRRRLKAGWHPQYDYLGYGMYARAIEAYQKAFGKDRIKVFLFEDLQSDPGAVCSEVFSFLDIDPGMKPDTSTVYNASGSLKHAWLHDRLFCKPSFLKNFARLAIPYERLQLIKHRIMAWNSEKLIMPESFKRKFQDFYRDDILALEKLLNRSLSAWLK